MSLRHGFRAVWVQCVFKVAEGWSANRPIGYELAHLALLTSSSGLAVHCLTELQSLASWLWSRVVCNTCSAQCNWPAVSICRKPQLLQHVQLVFPQMCSVQL
jgi:hypothetical protein